MDIMKRVKNVLVNNSTNINKNKQNKQRPLTNTKKQ